MITSTNDILKEIEIIKVRLACYKQQKSLLHEIMYAFTSPVRELKGMVYSDMPGGSTEVTYERYVEGMRILETKIEIENRILKNMEETNKKIDDKINELDDVEYRVAYMKGNKIPLQDIADKLGYSLGYIKLISSKLNRVV